MEHVASMLPWMFLFAIPLVFLPGVRNALYEWMTIDPGCRMLHGMGRDVYEPGD